MSYEQHCNDYALYGDPMRDAMDYEENARYDRWDGHRGEVDWCGIQADMAPDDCGEYNEPIEVVEDAGSDDWDDVPF